MNHSGISGQKTKALFRNVIDTNIDMQLRLRLELHSPVGLNVELPRSLMFLFEIQKQLSTLA